MAVNNDLIDIFNDCIDRLNRGESVENILQDYPAMASQLRPMLEAGLLTKKISYPVNQVNAVRDRIQFNAQQAVDSTFGGGSSSIWASFLFVLIIGGVLLGLGTLFVLHSRENVSDTMQAQVSETPTTSIQFEGIVTSLDLNQIIVNTLVVDITEATVTGTIQVGASVSIDGNLVEGDVVAFTVVVLSTPQPIPTANSPFTGELDVTDQILVVEGIVSAINNNTITIYDMYFELQPDDPRLTVIESGDVVRIEGQVVSPNSIIILNLTFVSVNIFVYEDLAWRDDNCGNAPPPWAAEQATEWFDQCVGIQRSSGSSGSQS